MTVVPRLASRLGALVVVLSFIAACASSSTEEPSASTLPPVSTTAAPDTQAPDTAPPAPATTGTVAPATSAAPTTTLPTPTTTAAPATTRAPDTGPGPGSSGCLTTAGPVVTVTITDPMPGPDFCLEIRQSQSLRVVNESSQAATLSIYQGSASNLFETPELAPGDTFESEAVGQAFPTGEWLLEVSTVTGWQGSLYVVTG